MWKFSNNVCRLFYVQIKPTWEELSLKRNRIVQIPSGSSKKHFWGKVAMGGIFLAAVSTSETFVNEVLILIEGILWFILFFRSINPTS